MTLIIGKIYLIKNNTTHIPPYRRFLIITNRRKKMGKKKRVYLASNVLKREIYKNKIRKINKNVIFVESAKDANFMIIPVEERIGLTNEQKNLIEEYSNILEISIIDAKTFLDDEGNTLYEHLNKLDSLSEDKAMGYELEI